MPRFPLDDLGGDDDFPQSGDRLQILSAEEYGVLWGFPRFTQSDRDLFFTLTAPERGALEQRRSIRTKIHFLLHLGYFRARQRFFRFELPAVRDDVGHLRRRYFGNNAVADLTVSDHDRYQRLNDNLLGASCSLVRRYAEEVDAATWQARAPSTRARSSGARSMPSWARSSATSGHCCGFSRCREHRATPGCWKRWQS